MSWTGWALLSALFAAATAALAKAGVKGVDANLATAIRTSVVVVLTWGIAAAAGPGPAALRAVERRSWAFLVLSGIATGLSWLCYFQALQAGPLSRVAPVDKLSVALTIACGVLLFGEPLTARTGWGAALVLAGVVLIATEG